MKRTFNAVKIGADWVVDTASRGCNQVAVIGGTALATVSAFVQAAVPADVTTAITTMSADATTVATAVLVAIIAVVAIKFIRKGL